MFCQVNFHYHGNYYPKGFAKGATVECWNNNNTSLTSISLICDELRDLVPFAQFKKPEKHPWRSVNFRKVAGLVTFLRGYFSRFLNCTNCTKSCNASHILPIMVFSVTKQCSTYCFIDMTANNLMMKICFCEMAAQWKWVSQLTFTCSKSPIETVEKGVKLV